MPGRKDEPSHKSLEERYSDEVSDAEFRDAIEKRDFDRFGEVDYDIAPFTPSEADKICECLYDRADKPVSDAAIDRAFEEIRTAALDIERQIRWARGQKDGVNWRAELRRKRPAALPRFFDENPDLLDLGLSLLGDELAKVGLDDYQRLREHLLKLTNKTLQGLLSRDPGPKGNEFLDAYFNAIAKAISPLTPRPLSRSVSYSATNPDISGRDRGPSVRLFLACCRPFYPDLSEAGVVKRLRKISKKDTESE